MGPISQEPPVKPLEGGGFPRQHVQDSMDK